MLHLAPKMTAVLLCAAALAGCAATAPADIAKMSGGDTEAGHAQKEAAGVVDKTMPTDLEGGVRQAQLMRFAGHYDDAIRVLSQLMLVASDDPRVVAEYGKSLAEKGRAQDAVEFLNRAIELSPNDWTLYSALGVSYDQLGNQTSARAAYEHALALRPEEPSVLNNYALSRMLANDPAGAHLLIGRAQAAGGASDSRIAANISLISRYSPPAPDAVPEAAAAKAGPAKPAITGSDIAPVTDTGSVAQNMPQPVTVSSLPPANNGVVMQKVPFDPFAGPVKLRASSVKAVANAMADNAKQAAPATAKPAANAKTANAKPAPAKTTDQNQVPSLRLAADARNP